MARFSAHPPPSERPAIVTGGSSGIGAAVGVALGACGHPVVLGARRVSRCAEVAASIGSHAHALPLDLMDESSVDAFAAAASELVGPIDIVVAAAGRTLPDTDAGAWAQALGVNLLGTVRLIRNVLADMIDRYHGDVVIVSSEMARRPRPGTSAYAASKWGIEGYARTLQMELEGTGVRASIVQPGQTLTEMGFDWEPDSTATILTEWTRWGLARHSHFLSPDAVAAAVGHVISTPPGTHLTMIEVQPEAPIR